MATKYKYVGETLPRHDGRQIVTGSVQYLSDMKLPGMLYGRVLRSPHPHAIIKSIDTSKAEALPGVKAVLTHADIPPDWRGGRPRVVRPLDSKVRYVGDAVALIAATAEGTADEALRLIAVEYQSLPAVFDVDEALEPGAPQLYIEAPGNALAADTLFGPATLQGLTIGDVEAGFAEADAVAEGTCYYENIPNALPPEPPGFIAWWEDPNRVTLWRASHGGHHDKVLLERAFDGHVDVRTISLPAGGSYGQKNMSAQLALQAIALSKATQRPVRLVLTKKEHLATFGLRIQSRMHARVGIKRDGRVTAVAGEWLVGTGAFSLTTQAQVAVGCGEAQLAVRSPNWDLKTKVVTTNRCPSGIVRGFGGQELKCCLIPLLGRAMQKLAIDPFEFLANNYVKPGDAYFWRDGQRNVYRGIDYTRALQEGARVFGWKDKWKGWLRPTAVDGSSRTGVGVGIHGNADIGESNSEASVRLDANGSATIYTAAAEHGTGQPGNLMKMVAEVLQLPLDRISTTPADTAITPLDFGAVGSRGTYAIGSACIHAAEDALRQLFEAAAPLLQCNPDELETIDGEVFCRHNPEKKVPWVNILGAEQSIMGQGRFVPDYTLANCMMSFVEVQVDTETGKVDLVRVVNATDAGKIIDPPGLANQMNGCLGSAGIDSALFEETVLDSGTGRMLNANLIDYKWRSFAELPEITNVVLETPAPSHRFHAIGVGEVATAPGPSAILMAISNAVGAWLYRYPVTPEQILEVLGKGATA